MMTFSFEARTTNLRPWTCVVATAAALMFSLSAIAATYTVTLLGSPGTLRYGGGINSSGQVAGNWRDSDGVWHAYLYSAGTMTDLGSLPGGGTIARAINDKGDIVGYSGNFAGNVVHAFLYTGGKMVDLGTRWDVASVATGINNNGQVVGYYWGPRVGDSYFSHAFVYSDGVVTDMGLSNILSNTANAINDNGQVVGSYFVDSAIGSNSTPRSHAYLHGAGALTDLGTLLTGPFAYIGTSATAINASGQIAGCSEEHAFVYSGGKMTNLGTVAGYGVGEPDQYCALGINAGGQVVGWATINLGLSGIWQGDPWVYSGGMMHDINTLTDPGSGWYQPNPGMQGYISDVAGINDAGQIAASGCGPPGCGVLVLTPMVVVEYRNTQDFPGRPGGNYFYTADAAEIAIVDSGVRGHFVRTGKTFNAGGSKQLCRFYGSVVPGPNSHFFGISDLECDGLKAAQKVPTPTDVQQWNYEGSTFAETPLSVGSGGPACVAGTIPVYRAYNNAFTAAGHKNPWDSAHRYSSDPSDIQQMVTQFGWRDEGMVFCSGQ